MFSQVRAMLGTPEDFPEQVEEEILALLGLLRQNGRMDSLKLIFYSFLDQYCEANGICMANITSAAPLEGRQLERFSSLLEEKTGKKVTLRSSTDSALLGGFVLDADGYTLDASVTSALNAVRRSFAEKHKRTI